MFPSLYTIKNTGVPKFNVELVPGKRPGYTSSSKSKKKSLFSELSVSLRQIVKNRLPRPDL